MKADDFISSLIDVNDGRLFSFTYNRQIIAEFENHYQLVSFRVLFEYIRKAFEFTTSNKARNDALNFIYNDLEIRGYKFIYEARTLNIEPDLLRLRLCYQLYKNNVNIDLNKIVFLSPLPEPLVSEILYKRENIVVPICRYIYKNPTVSKKQVISCFEHKYENNIKLDNLLKELVQDGYLGLNEEKLYFIGRNPGNLNLKNFSWSKQWVF